MAAGHLRFPQARAAGQSVLSQNGRIQLNNPDFPKRILEIFDGILAWQPYL